MAIDLNKQFVGYYIEFFDIDVIGIGGADKSVYHFAPSIDYNDVNGVTSLFDFNGQIYIPMPCKLTGVGSSSTGAPSTPTLTVSNIDKQLFNDVINNEGLIGATIVRHRTFSEYIGLGEELEQQKFIISQVLGMTREEISFKLNLPIDFEGAKLPFRTVLKDVGFPGVSRNGSR